MIIVAIRTDNPTAEVYVYDGSQQVAAKQWQGHRQLSETLHAAIRDVLADAGLDIHQVQGLVAFKGPGSFTGLRIGLSVVNALGYSNACPVVATQGDSWQADGIARLLAGENDGAALPHYDVPVFTTKPRK